MEKDLSVVLLFSWLKFTLKGKKSWPDEPKGGNDGNDAWMLAASHEEW